MEKKKMRVAFISVLAAIFLTTFKIVIGVLTGSLGILSEALHSTLDLVAAVITFFSVRVSDKPADNDHNFGHGKVENLSAFLETILLLITCVWIIYEAIHRLVTGNTVIEINVWSFVVVLTSIAIDFTRSRALLKVAKETNSQALEADALHFSTDIWSSTVVLFGLIFASFGIYLADPIAALAVAAIVIYISVRLGKKSIEVLLDKVPEETRRKVEGIMAKVSEITAFHDLKVRTSGADTFVEVNIHVDPELSIGEAHMITDKIEDDIREAIPRCEVHVHAEPEELHVFATNINRTMTTQAKSIFTKKKLANRLHKN
ncbi:MAG TPA: cation diffusion facilitator family transporter [Williamwhitmania sp.]|nr:cation diffusion facilitator family transporter [Williamwhitmania sp.]